MLDIRTIGGPISTCLFPTMRSARRREQGQKRQKRADSIPERRYFTEIAVPILHYRVATTVFPCMQDGVHPVFQHVQSKPEQRLTGLSAYRKRATLFCRCDPGIFVILSGVAGAEQRGACCVTRSICDGRSKRSRIAATPPPRTLSTTRRISLRFRNGLGTPTCRRRVFTTDARRGPRIVRRFRVRY